MEKYFITPLHGSGKFSEKSTSEANCKKAVKLFKTLPHANFILLSGRTRRSGKGEPSTGGITAKASEMYNYLKRHGVQEFSIKLPNAFDSMPDAPSAFGLRGQVHSLQKIVASFCSRSTLHQHHEVQHIIVVCSAEQLPRAKFLWWVHRNKNIDVTFHTSGGIRKPFVILHELGRLAQEIKDVIQEYFLGRRNTHCSFCGHKTTRNPQRKSFFQTAQSMTGIGTCTYCEGAKLATMSSMKRQSATI